MPTHSRKGTVEAKAFRPKPARAKRRSAQAAKPSVSVSDLKHELERQNELLDEAREQQEATAEILKVINASSGNLTPVFDIILEKAHNLCDVPCGSLQLFEDDHTRAVAVRGMTEPFEKFLRQGYRLDRSQPVQANRPFQIADLAKVVVGVPHTSALRVAFELGRIRTMLSVPLIRDTGVLGRIVAARHEVRPFSKRQIAVLQSFADQAVIAIENARLLNEVRESLEQQTATSEVLQVINASPGDLKPVFDAMLDKAMRLCEASMGGLAVPDGELARWVARRGIPEAYDDWMAHATMRLSSVLGPALRDRSISVLHTLDVKETEGYRKRNPFIVATVELGGARTGVVVPLVKDDALVGVFGIYRQEVRAFSDKQIALLQNFAAQAVIAIENARLLTETREALERQIATAEVLQVINSSPGDLAPVFQAILERAHSLCGVSHGSLQLYDGEKFSAVAAHGIVEAFAERLRQGYVPGSNHPSKQLLQGARFAQVPDCAEINDPIIRAAFELGGIRTVLLIPLRKEGSLIGQIAAARRDVSPFTEKEIALLENFAAQAVIAIENARLFSETQEALERQTATADILKVIASSPDNVQPVFQAIADRSNRLVDALSTTVFRLVDGMLHLRAFTPTTPEADAKLRAMFPAPLSAFNWGKAIANSEIYSVIDAEQEPERLREVARERGWRSALIVPLLRDGKPIGMIGPTRAEPGPFTDHHVQLMQTFADQAVIAIQNVELFEKVQARTRELSQSLDDLRAAQDRLIQTEKLASLGQLTAGIAHEIKNPLNFVNNFSVLSTELVDELNDVLDGAKLDEIRRQEFDDIRQLLKGNLEKVVQHGKRADAIVKNMLLHSRSGSGEHRAVEVNAIIEESLNLAYHGARAEGRDFNITLERDFDPAVGFANVYPQEITRVLLNLISNSFYAATKRAAEAGNGFEPKLIAVTRDLGDKVEIRIRDNGTGIPLGIREKIFNPFFTTKPAGEGTGLGLSMSHEIVVKQHGGKIEVVSEPGSFTEFIITLPRLMPAQAEQGEQGN